MARELGVFVLTVVVGRLSGRLKVSLVWIARPFALASSHASCAAWGSCDAVARSASV